MELAQNELPGKREIDKKFESWVKEYTAAMLNYTRTRISQNEAAEDLVQLTFEAAYISYSGYKERSSPKNWLFSILKNKIADHYRSVYRAPSSVSIYELDEKSEFFDEQGNWLKNQHPREWDEKHLLDDPEFNTALGNCIKALPPKMHSVVQLKYIDNTSSTAIIEDLEISPGNFWQLMHRAKLKLRACLESKWFKN